MPVILEIIKEGQRHVTSVSYWQVASFWASVETTTSDILVVVDTPGLSEPAPDWPPEKAKEFELLLAEADHSDEQIGSYMGLQTKQLGILFPAIGAIIAAVFAAKDGVLSDQNAAKALLTLSLIGSFGILQTSITYGSTLTYMHYKNEVLGPKLKALLNLHYKPLSIIDSFVKTGVNGAVFFATYFATLGITLLNFGLLCYCWHLAHCERGLQLAIGAGFAGVIGSIAALVRTRQAIKAVHLLSSKQSSAITAQSDR
jgi:hypothetical protein